MDEPDSTVRENPMECVREAVYLLERRLEEQRFREKLIGRVSEHNRDLIEIKPHTVSFSWHRGFKIGAGHFGKVYTAVNNNSGELMAMKVLPLQPNDHRSIKKVANELKTFERINHPNLVRYYGIEIHNDEMLMFMEYCDEGTLEALAASTEGLPEEIEPNIFLAKEGNVLKLGDFGCAVRIRGLQTEVNELSGIVGTHAYMAPEIFRSNEGHGRAADIWSVGCVVIEMLTGKRPWPQYDSSVQIMFQVGCGKSPSFPENLSEEGEIFLLHCFVHSPKDRATASSLLDHTFVKVEEEENMSLPLFSLNSVPQAKRSRLFSNDIKT
ncbi:MAP kinase kinase kinase wis4 [Armadillidium nasatum]|uniref:MAP kinase kinase kinase wis4 n=1 Tax=Armadillidium nasatum TaxID=96803 RepID=A0A5N5TKF5_9CRUS|nr:MAP kinase kinase kinase wis4 [Armadillidium nasatum]